MACGMHLESRVKAKKSDGNKFKFEGNDASPSILSSSARSIKEMSP